MTLADVLRQWIPRKTVTDRFLVLLSAKARATGAADAEQLWASLQGDVQKLMQNALADGITPAEFKGRLAGLLQQYGVGDLKMPDGKAADASPWYADLVYRQTHANAAAEGRDMALFDDEYLERAPFWRFLAIEDSRNDSRDECPDTICRSLDGLLFEKKDSSAQLFLPPLHFQCRCEAQELTAAEAKRRGLTPRAGSSISLRPASGFGGRRFA